MIDDEKDVGAPAGWVEALEESQAELDAGLTVPGEIVRQDLLDSLARIKANHDRQPPKGAAQRR